MKSLSGYDTTEVAVIIFVVGSAVLSALVFVFR
jgi:hypothetical protein